MKKVRFVKIKKYDIVFLTSYVENQGHLIIL